MYKFYLYYSIISCVLYTSASIVFFVLYSNIQGGLWAAFAAALSVLCFCLHKLYFANKLQEYVKDSTLSCLNTLGFLVCLLGTTFSLWYFFTIVYWKIPLFDYNRTTVFPCVFSFLTGKWGLHLYSTSKKFSEISSSDYSPLVQSI